ncbi:hypothetical protein V1527DRAFT_493436 [Lipomyces starkeyi]
MLLDILPFGLKCTFPAVLTHKSGISQEMAGQIRVCFGMGPAPFRSMIQQLHRERYDMHRLAYLEAIERLMPALRGYGAEVSMPSPITSFNNKFGYNGFAPSAGYLTGVYNTIIESCSEEMAKRMSMIPMTIAKIDHSFKLTKLVVQRTDSSHSPPHFRALMKYGEIRILMDDLHMALGYRRPLERNDIWLINPSRSTHKLAANLKGSFQEHHAKGNKNPLLRALFQTFKFEFVLGGVAAFVSNMVQVMLGGPGPHINKGIGLVLCLTVMQILSSIGQNHFFYRGMMVGGQARSALISIIFDKAMTISGRAKAAGKILQPPPAGIQFESEEEKKHYEAQVDIKAEKPGTKKKGESEYEDVEGWRNGRIVNLMSVDTYRIDQACGWLHMVWRVRSSEMGLLFASCLRQSSSSLSDWSTATP